MKTYAIILLGVLMCATAKAAPMGASLTGGNPRGYDLTLQGTIVDESTNAASVFLGYPSLIKTGSVLLASHDLFYHGVIPDSEDVTHILASEDNGETWTNRSSVWMWNATLFGHDGAVYMAGYSNGLLMAKSTDMGMTWTTALINASLKTGGMPPVTEDGYLYISVVGDGVGYVNTQYVASVAVGTDIMDSGAWTISSGVAWNAAWTPYQGWAEGNMVTDPGGDMKVVMRVYEPTNGNVACYLDLSEDRTTLSFTTNFFAMPGGCVRFHVREVDDVYYLMSNAARVPNIKYRVDYKRNLLTWSTSTNLTDWTVQSDLLYHPDFSTKGYQYPFWIQDGDNVLAVIRTAGVGNLGVALSCHDSNLITFHNFGALIP